MTKKRNWTEVLTTLPSFLWLTVFFVIPTLIVFKNGEKVNQAVGVMPKEQILDLAVELPVYQRSVLYAFNSKVIKADSMPKSSEMNPYSSPLDRIWEIEFAG